MKWVALAVAVAAVSGALVLSLYMLFRKVLPRRAEEIERAFGGRQVIKSTRRANSFGKLSMKYARIKGNGVLALFPEELVFHMFYPKLEYHVPLDRIEKIEHPKFFRGRSALREILAVCYTEEDGSEDAIGILVEDPHDWANVIKQEAFKRHTRMID